MENSFLNFIGTTSQAKEVAKAISAQYPKNGWSVTISDKVNICKIVYFHCEEKNNEIFLTDDERKNLSWHWKVMVNVPEEYWHLFKLPEVERYAIISMLPWNYKPCVVFITSGNYGFKMKTVDKEQAHEIIEKYGKEMSLKIYKMVFENVTEIPSVYHEQEDLDWKEFYKTMYKAEKHGSEMLFNEKTVKVKVTEVKRNLLKMHGEYY